MSNEKPFEILSPDQRWIPTKSQLSLVQNAYDKLLPPLVHKVREAVCKWREDGYNGASETSKALLNFWFKKEHRFGEEVFRFYFPQREAVESIIYLYEVKNARDKYELMKYDSSGRISTGMFYETWTRYVVKMATGSGKTKVMALALVWSYFHKLYEKDSPLSRNFLIIAPNIIVLNRLRKDFDNFKMLREEPFIPDNGIADRDWKDDFSQLSLHIQDELKPISETGNVFLTNIHRVYWQENETKTFEEEFLGSKPKPDADTAKGLDLGRLLRSGKLKDLVVFNDEAHHIHDPELQWFKSIEEISNKLKLKYGIPLPLQVDFTATPRHDGGAIFVQTICDYPLVEAIRQNIVKSPALPDAPSRSKLSEKTSSDFIERYRDFIHLGYLEWEGQFKALEKVKTPIIFIMTTVTSEADEVAAYLEKQYPKLKGKVLTIHTNRTGEIREKVASKKDEKELEVLREAADAVDKDSSPYRAVVSVLMLREGWDVKNVTTIVGLRPYQSSSKILPEQTLGRGIRKMFDLDVKEELVVVGTSTFIEFVEGLKTEGIEFEYRPMGIQDRSKSPIIVEVDRDNEKKDIEKLDIPIPHLTPRIYREYKNLELINVETINAENVKYRTFPEKELKVIRFVDIDNKFSHDITFTDTIPDYRNMIAFFTKNVLKESRLVRGFDVLYPKVEQFIKERLFDRSVELENPQTLRNLSEIVATNALYRSFKRAIDNLTVSDKGSAEIRDHIKLKDTKPVPENNQPYIIPKRSIFNRVIGDNGFELEFAKFLDDREDILSFAKNHKGVNFKMEYKGEDGNIHDYYPDFFVKVSEKNIFIVETKGREDLDDLRKIRRLFIWCQDINALQNERVYTPVYVKQEEWESKKEAIKSFKDIVTTFEVKS
jgi:type III restriction enzyme